MFFFIPFPFPNWGNGFFHSLHVPELREWNYPFPFLFPNSQMSFPLTPVPLWNMKTQIMKTYLSTPPNPDQMLSKAVPAHKEALNLSPPPFSSTCYHISEYWNVQWLVTYPISHFMIPLSSWSSLSSPQWFCIITGVSLWTTGLIPPHSITPRWLILLVSGSGSHLFNDTLSGDISRLQINIL